MPSATATAVAANRFVCYWLGRYIQAVAMLTHGSDLGNAQLEYGVTRAASSIVREFYGRPSVRFPMSRR